MAIAADVALEQPPLDTKRLYQVVCVGTGGVKFCPVALATVVNPVVEDVVETSQA